jgi:nucleoside-diphosphate-sugar epimerase
VDISLYGGTGFIGSTYHQRFINADNITVIPRWKQKPSSNTDILYMISTTNNYNVFKDATIDVTTNLEVFTETLDSWRHNNPDRVFNFISSWFVYGNEYPAVGYEAQKRAFNDVYGEGYYTYDGGALETDDCHPKGFYSITKYCAEQLLQSYAKTFDLKYRILRLSNVLGKDDKNVSKQKNALQYLINEMKEGRYIQVYDGGEFYRNYIHVNDCCDAIRLVMEKGDLNTIYNIGAGNHKFMDMLSYVASKIGYLSDKFQFIEQVDFHKNVQAKSFLMNTDRLKGLGFVPTYDMETMLTSLL